MRTWKRKPQEQEGKHLFSGTLVVTQGVMHTLHRDEISAIYFDTLNFVMEKGGIDYLQVYESEDGLKVYLIDNCSPEQMEHLEFQPEDNYCTLLLAEEY
jgi:hypothetical protein